MKSAKSVALGGMLAAVAVVVMCLGGLIPFATFVCPTICILVLQMVRSFTTNRIALAWYGAVSILCVLLAPDKEAAAVFAQVLKAVRQCSLVVFQSAASTMFLLRTMQRST